MMTVVTLVFAIGGFLVILREVVEHCTVKPRGR
jgi:hypothetical protein